jgi:hypothetical protein
MYQKINTQVYCIGAFTGPDLPTENYTAGQGKNEHCRYGFKLACCSTPTSLYIYSL